MRMLAIAFVVVSACAARNMGGGDDGGGDGAWTGIRVEGQRFVDGDGRAFVPRGIGVGEWTNIESYMLGLELESDVPGLGQSRLREKLVQAMGEDGADAFFTAWLDNVVTESDVALWKSWDVNSVRLPLNHHSIDFARVDRFIEWCKANGIYVVLDLHAAPGAQNCEEMSDSTDGVAHLWTEPAAYRQATIDLWKEIATRYRDETAVAGYDLLDEPYDTEANADFSTGIGTLRAFYVDVTAAIRSVDSHHVIFVEGTHWAGDPEGLLGLAPAWDPQLAWTFHKYWDGNDEASIAGYLALRDETARPVWNGETGEDNATGWSGAMIALLERHEIGWNMWTYKKVDNDTDYYSIRPPTGWATMKAYLEGRGSAPAAADARRIMLELAANAATSQCQLQAHWLAQTFGDAAGG